MSTTAWSMMIDQWWHQNVSLWNCFLHLHQNILLERNMECMYRRDCLSDRGYGSWWGFGGSMARFGICRIVSTPSIGCLRWNTFSNSAAARTVNPAMTFLELASCKNETGAQIFIKRTIWITDLSPIRNYSKFIIFSSVIVISLKRRT